MNNIMEIGTCVVELAIMFFYLNNVLSKKKEIGCRIWFMYIGIFVINVARSYLYLPMNTNSIITFVLCVIGVKIGNRFGSKYESKAEFAGGLILIFIGASKIFMTYK